MITVQIKHVETGSKHLRLWHEASPLPRDSGGRSSSREPQPAHESARHERAGASARNLSREQACQTQSQSQSQPGSAASHRRSKSSSHEMARPPEREVTRAQEAAAVAAERRRRQTPGSSCSPHAFDPNVRSKLPSHPSPHPSHITRLPPQGQAVVRVRALLPRSLSTKKTHHRPLSPPARNTRA